MLLCNNLEQIVPNWEMSLNEKRQKAQASELNDLARRKMRQAAIFMLVFKHSRHVAARDKDGQPILVSDPRLVSLCMYGAILKASNGDSKVLKAMIGLLMPYIPR